MTFFEGLVGVDADINAVFEIEEEFDSALDADNNDGFSIRNRGRRPSSRTERVTTGVPLGKFNTTMSAQSYSPLAQVYNPVVIDDNMEDSSNPGHSAQPVISYGPATRRRFTPIQRRPVGLSDQAHSTQLRRFPTIPTMNMKKVSPPAHGILRSRSQDRYLKMQPSTAPQSEVSDMSDGEHPQRPEFMQRLDDIEKRQERIESLLIHISQTISSNKLTTSKHSMKATAEK